MENENKTNPGTRVRTARAALAQYAEAGSTLAGEDAYSLTTYAWLDAHGHTIKATVVDLGLEEV
jgi:hypothetical protein